MKYITLLLTLTACLTACNNSPQIQQASVLPAFEQGDRLKLDQVLHVDLNQDLSTLSFQELRILKNALYARQGYCFTTADMRAYFTAKIPAYDSIMEDRWWAEEEGVKAIAPISFTSEENAFLAKIDALIKERQKNNLIEHDGATMANLDNVVNLFQLEKFPTGLLDKLRANNFAIVPGDKEQLFHVYEENDYRQFPNFLTTDMYLQVYHMYFSYTLKYLEEKKFIGILQDLCENVYDQSVKIAASNSNAALKDQAERTATMFSIAFELLTGKKKIVPVKYLGQYAVEMKNIAGEVDVPSPFLKTDGVFAYSLFKPRGHYTRKETLKRYFRAMMWVQTAFLCREKESQLQTAIYMAMLLNDDASGKLMNDYNAIYEPVAFLIGEPDNVSVLDICNLLKTNKITGFNKLQDKATQTVLANAIKSLCSNKNRIRPAEAINCVDKINFMPQRYLPDNEVLNTMHDARLSSQRPTPKGLDVFAAFGVARAEEILKTEEVETWDSFPSRLDANKARFKEYGNWDASVYNKWLECLVALQKPDKNYPGFMQTKAWDKKNLNTALASWAQLKHDAILYGEQPMAAECGGAGPPAPITVGFVEPNIAFWSKLIELNTLTKTVLERNNLLTEDLAALNRQLGETFTSWLTISQKELRHEKLNETEYRHIEIAGSNVEWLTLSLIDPESHFQYWSDIKGPDRCVATVADVFTRNVGGSYDVLHEATGFVNEIYVLVEIDNYVYLTKGATFSYYEFVDREGKRWTDEEWQNRLKNRNAPSAPGWMKEIMLPGADSVKVNDRIFYSSGC